MLYVDPTGEQVCIAEWVPLIGQEGCVPILVTHTDTVLDGTQLALDAVGLVPGLGEVADGLNGCISLVRGNVGDALLSFSAAIPLLGMAATGGKWGKRVANAAPTGARVFAGLHGRAVYDALNDGDILSTSKVLDAGDAFVGPNPIQQADGVFISRQPVDGTDVHAMFRITDADLADPIDPPHANFQIVQRIVVPGTNRVRYQPLPGANKHIYISDP